MDEKTEQTLGNYPESIRETRGISSRTWPKSILKNRNILIAAMLFIFFLWVVYHGLIPAASSYYRLNKINGASSQKLKYMLEESAGMGPVDPPVFRSGIHGLPNNLLAILSYMDYLKERGWIVRAYVGGAAMRAGFCETSGGHTVAGKSSAGNYNKSYIKASPAIHVRNGVKARQSIFNRAVEFPRAERVAVEIASIRDISMLFAILKTFYSFPAEIKEISIRGVSGPNEKVYNYNAFICLKLSGVKHNKGL